MSQGEGNVIANEAPRMKDVCQVRGDHKHRTMTIRSKGAQPQAEMKLVSTTCNLLVLLLEIQSNTHLWYYFIFYYFFGPIFLLNFLSYFNLHFFFLAYFIHTRWSSIGKERHFSHILFDVWKLYLRQLISVFVRVVY